MRQSVKLRAGLGWNCICQSQHSELEVHIKPNLKI